MTRSLSRLTLLAAPVAFAAMLAVLVLLMGTGRGDGVAGPAADAAALRAAPDAPSPRATTDQRIRDPPGDRARRPAPRRRLRPRSRTPTLQKVRETGDAAYYVRADAVLRRALHLRPARRRRADRARLARRLSPRLPREPARRAARRAAPAPGRRASRTASSSTRSSSSAATARPAARCRRWSTASPTSRPTRASPTSASSTATCAERSPRCELAVSAGGGTPENTAYVQALLGDLEFARGDLGAAAVAYRQALFALPHHAPSEVGLAKVEAARGDLRRRDPSPPRRGRAPPAAAVRRRARRDRARRRPPGRRASRPRARRRRGAAARARRRQHRRRARALRGRPRQPGARRDARAPGVGERAERARRPTRSAGR